MTTRQTSKRSMSADETNWHKKPGYGRHRRFEEAFIPNGQTVAEYEATVLARSCTADARIRGNLGVIDLTGNDQNHNFGNQVTSGQGFARITEESMVKHELIFDGEDDPFSAQDSSVWKITNVAEMNRNPSAAATRDRAAPSPATNMRGSADRYSDAGSNYRSSEHDNTAGTIDTISEASHSVFNPAMSELHDVRAPTRRRLKRHSAATHWYLNPRHGVIYAAGNGEPRRHCAYCPNTRTMRHYRNIRAHLLEHGITESLRAHIRTNDAETRNRPADILTGVLPRGTTRVTADAVALSIAAILDDQGDDDPMNEVMSLDFVALAEDADDAAAGDCHSLNVGDAMKHLRFALASPGLSTDTKCTKIRGVIEEAYQDLALHQKNHSEI